MYVKWSHLIIVAIMLFLLFYIWVELGGRHGKPPVIDTSSPPIERNKVL